MSVEMIALRWAWLGRQEDGDEIRVGRCGAESCVLRKSAFMGNEVSVSEWRGGTVSFGCALMEFWMHPGQA